jgi:hypothetical protein
MNQQPDKFFRDKLLGYQQETPPNAWNRVSQNVTNRKRKLWLRYAASILIVAACGVALFPLLRDATVQTVAENNSTPEKREPSRQDTTLPDKPQDDQTTSVEDRHEPLAGPSLPEKPPARTAPRKKPSPATNQASKSEGMIAAEQARAVATEGVSKEMVTKDQSNLVAIKTDDQEPEPESVDDGQRKSVTIVFTAEEVNKKYLQKNEEAEATTDAKSTSGLRKLLDKANDLTTNQDLLGDLRQKKNEILAMNFKSEKQRSEND